MSKLRTNIGALLRAELLLNLFQFGMLLSALPLLAHHCFAEETAGFLAESLLWLYLIASFTVI